jgi:hypothetical protein
MIKGDNMNRNSEPSVELFFLATIDGEETKICRYELDTEELLPIAIEWLEKDLKVKITDPYDAEFCMTNYFK